MLRKALASPRLARQIRELLDFSRPPPLPTSKLWRGLVYPQRDKITGNLRWVPMSRTHREQLARRQEEWLQIPITKIEEDLAALGGFTAAQTREAQRRFLADYLVPLRGRVGRLPRDLVSEVDQAKKELMLCVSGSLPGKLTTHQFDPLRSLVTDQAALIYLFRVWGRPRPSKAQLRAVAVTLSRQRKRRR